MPTEKDNSGVLWKNSYKQTERQPDFKGDAIIDGKPKRISAWIKSKADGEKYFSLSIEEPYVAPAEGLIQPKEEREEIPF